MCALEVSDLNFECLNSIHSVRIVFMCLFARGIGKKMIVKWVQHALLPTLDHIF